MFPKMGLFKTEKLGKIKNIQVFEILCLDRPEASPNNWKHRSGKDTEIQGPVRRETDLSPFRVVPAIDLNQLCTGVFLLLSSHGKIQISNLLRLFGPKKETRVMIMLWLPPQFSVERRKPQIFENDWNDCSASGNHVTLVSVRWPWLHPSWCLRGSWHSSGLENLLRHYLWLRMRSKNLIGIYVSLAPYSPPRKVALTFCLRQGQPVRRFLYKWFNLVRSNI